MLSLTCKIYIFIKAFIFCSLIQFHGFSNIIRNSSIKYLSIIKKKEKNNFLLSSGIILIICTIYNYVILLNISKYQWASRKLTGAKKSTNQGSLLSGPTLLGLKSSGPRETSLVPALSLANADTSCAVALP